MPKKVTTQNMTNVELAEYLCNAENSTVGNGGVCDGLAMDVGTGRLEFSACMPEYGYSEYLHINPLGKDMYEVTITIHTQDHRGEPSPEELLEDERLARENEVCEGIAGDIIDTIQGDQQ